MAIWLISWDDVGLEAVINYTDVQKKYLEKSLTSDNLTDPYQLVQALKLRAIYNPQRHYEVYAINIEDELKKADILEWFNGAPEVFKEVIREKAQVKIF